MDGCLDRALVELVRRASTAPGRAVARHRVPLGLVLLSRQQLTAEQLQRGLAVQQADGHGKIGHWLERLGFISEAQLTAALARQWSCPVLMKLPGPERTARAPRLPASLLVWFEMVPVDFVATTATLHVAFGQEIDYGVLYAIEQMAGCRTQPCMAPASLIRECLQAILRQPQESDVVFDGIADAAESARIVRSYAARVSASEIRLAACRSGLWVRLLRSGAQPLDLLLRCGHEGFRGERQNAGFTAAG